MRNQLEQKLREMNKSKTMLASSQTRKTSKI